MSTLINPSPPAVITVPYQQLAYAGAAESVDMVGVYATLSYLVAWSDRWQFMRDVAGQTVLLGTPAAPVIIRQCPLQYPDNKNLYANGISLEPVGNVYCGQYAASYDKAKITVTFGTPSFDYQAAQGEQNTVYRTISFDMGGEVMTMPESAVQFSTGAVPPNQEMGLFIPSVAITITSHQIPYLALEQIFPLVGSLNNALFYGCNTGQLMFLGARANRSATSAGLQAWELEYNFKYRAYDWNMFFSPTPGVGFDFLFLKETTTGVYSYADFTTLP